MEEKRDSNKTKYILGYINEKNIYNSCKGEQKCRIGTKEQDKVKTQIEEG